MHLTSAQYHHVPQRPSPSSSPSRAAFVCLPTYLLGGSKCQTPHYSQLPNRCVCESVCRPSQNSKCGNKRRRGSLLALNFPRFQFCDQSQTISCRVNHLIISCPRGIVYRAIKLTIYYSVRRRVASQRQAVISYRHEHHYYPGLSEPSVADIKSVRIGRGIRTDRRGWFIRDRIEFRKKKIMGAG